MKRINFQHFLLSLNREIDSLLNYVRNILIKKKRKYFRLPLAHIQKAFRAAILMRYVIEEQHRVSSSVTWKFSHLLESRNWTCDLPRLDKLSFIAAAHTTHIILRNTKERGRWRTFYKLKRSWTSEPMGCWWRTEMAETETIKRYIKIFYHNKKLFTKWILYVKELIIISNTQYSTEKKTEIAEIALTALLSPFVLLLVVVINILNEWKC